MMQKKKTTQGRKKIEIRKIEDLNTRQVTFSKRRAGLFNKASELSILTGAEAAILVESPGGRVFAFGHPNVETVVERYLGENSSRAPGQQQPGFEADQAMHEGLKHSQQYSDIFEELVAEKKKKAAAKEAAKEPNEGDNNGFWWDKPIEGLGLEELEEYITAMEKLRNNLLTRANELAMTRKSSTSDPSQNPNNNNNNNNVFRVDDYLACDDQPADLYKNDGDGDDDDMVCEDGQI